MCPVIIFRSLVESTYIIFHIYVPSAQLKSLCFPSHVSSTECNVFKSSPHRLKIVISNSEILWVIALKDSLIIFPLGVNVFGTYMSDSRTIFICKLSEHPFLSVKKTV